MSASGSDEDEGAAAPSMQALLGRALGQGGSDDSSDDEAAPAPVAASEPAAGSERGGSSSAGEAAGSSSEPLPSALDLLDAASGKPDFLRPEALEPEFDASKGFKPPPVTAAELMPTVHDTDNPTVGTRQRFAPSLSEHQRHDPEFQHGPEHGKGRMQGSVFHETDEQRGRRILYGAHQVIKADPWSECNPNYKTLKHSEMVRGKKRPAPGSAFHDNKR